MAQKNSEGQVCQSCGRPTSRPDEFGTNSDGSRSDEYCNFCFQNGKFTYPNITAEHMIEIYASLMVTLKDMPENEARETAKSIIPGLKRWK